MYTDPGADTKEGYKISSTSRKLARAVVGDETPEDRIRQRCAISVGDFVMADLMVFRKKPVEAGLQALNNAAPIITDIRMVQTGIRKKEHNSKVICALDYGSEFVEKHGITRSSAGYLELSEQLNGAIIIIGNAPSALLRVCDMIQNDGLKPALVIGTAVGFVNAAKSKEILRNRDVPSISNIGTRGGTPPAVAAMNEIITIFIEKNR